jgi:hypothetical protein
MKHLNFYNIMLAAFISVSLCGCEQKNTPQTEVPEPPLSITVIKFKQPEYKNYILAANLRDSKGFEATRGYLCDEPIGKTGISPYWDLEDGWVMVDWNWPGFPYAISTALTEQTWDNFVWPGNEGKWPNWPETEPHTGYPFSHLLYISVANLEIYSNAHYGKEMIRLIHAPIKGEAVCSISPKMDSVWTVLQSNLNDAIKKGELEKINNKEYEPAPDYYWWW